MTNETYSLYIWHTIDELRYQLKQDTIELRMKSLALEPWSTNFINKCIEKGAK